MELSGEVENISGKKLENIKALAAFYTASGDLITSDDSMLELNPVMPGQKTPFKVLTRYNPEMEKATLRFTSIWGEQIETTEN